MSVRRSAAPGTAALLVVIATAGTLLALGQRDDDPTKAFRNGGRMLLAARLPQDALLPIFATAAGMLHHIIIAAIWGALMALCIRRLSGVRYLLASLLAAVTFALLNLWLLPAVLGIGFAVVTSVAQAVPFTLAVAVALMVTPWASRVSHEYSSAALAG